MIAQVITMNKLKYILLVLLMAAVTLSFMVMPSIADSINGNALSKASITDVDLYTSNKQYACKQIFEILSDGDNSSGMFIKTENKKSNNELLYLSCNIIKSITGLAPKLCDSLINVINTSKNKDFTTIRFVRPYENEIVKLNVVICEYDGITLCYEEQNCMPMFIIIDFYVLSESTDFAQSYEYYADTSNLLYEGLLNYYASIGIPSMYRTTSLIDYYNDYNESYSDISKKAYFIGCDVMLSFFENIRINDFSDSSIEYDE